MGVLYGPPAGFEGMPPWLCSDCGEILNPPPVIWQGPRQTLQHAACAAHKGAALRKACREAELPEMERWYNGYRFADQVIYNPWSVLNFLASPDGVLRPYWVSTGSMDLVRDLPLARDGDEAEATETPLRGRGPAQPPHENLPPPPRPRTHRIKPTEKLHEIGPRIWLANLTRGLLSTGTLQR